MKHKLTAKSVVPILIICICYSCTTKNEPKPDIVYSGMVMNQFKNCPFSNTKIFLYETKFETTSGNGNWWEWDNYNFYKYDLAIDSFVSDSFGRFSFKLNSKQQQALSNLYLYFIVSEQYQSIRIPGTTFNNINSIMIKPWSYLKINYKNYNNNRSCDFYFLDIATINNDSSYTNLLSWDYNTSLPKESVKRIQPGFYYIKATCGCAGFNGKQIKTFQCNGFDTIEVKNLLTL